MNTNTNIKPDPTHQPPDAEEVLPVGALARGSRVSAGPARAHNWKPFVKNTLRGFFSLKINRKVGNTNGRFLGIGFVFTDDDPYAGVDLDNCLNPDGTVMDWPILPACRHLRRSEPQRFDASLHNQSLDGGAG